MLRPALPRCSEIVDRAQKELIIEKALKKIEETWVSLNLTFSPYQDTDNVQMTVEDVITEALETDNLALQNMSGGKYVQASRGSANAAVQQDARASSPSCKSAHSIGRPSQAAAVKVRSTLAACAGSAPGLPRLQRRKSAAEESRLTLLHTAGQSKVLGDCHQLAAEAGHRRRGAKYLAGCSEEVAGTGVHLCGQRRHQGAAARGLQAL